MGEWNLNQHLLAGTGSCGSRYEEGTDTERSRMRPSACVRVETQEYELERQDTCSPSFAVRPLSIVASNDLVQGAPPDIKDTEIRSWEFYTVNCLSKEFSFVCLCACKSSWQIQGPHIVGKKHKQVFCSEGSLNRKLISSQTDEQDF